jgi:AraC family transcriptional regulator, regulatory protein of adaptative response / DNA-3-methyladenine glycosylase II
MASLRLRRRVLLPAMSKALGLTRAALDRARISRDARFDGKFFIAVLSTGIYCRPICPSPRCKKPNVLYYATAAAAAAAGYRPCLRCRPEVAPGSAAWLGPSAVVRRALRLIQAGALDDASVEALAMRVGVGPRYLGRLFSEHVGVPPIAVAQTRRLHFAKQLLDETTLPITQIAMSSGFGSLRRFNDAFRNAYGRAPRELRQKSMSRRSAKPVEAIELCLSYRPPYDWSHMFGYLASHLIAGVERVDANGYVRTIRLDSGYATIGVHPIERKNVVCLRVSGAPAPALLELATTARRMFDLSADPAQIADVFGIDPLLGPLVQRRPGIRIPGAWDPWECAVAAIVAQQGNAADVRNACRRLVECFGERIEADGSGLTHIFPSALAIAGANLEKIDLPRGTALTLQTLAHAVHEGKVDFSTPADDAIKSLTAIQGVSLWAAGYIALRALGEPDAFPFGDPALRRIAAGEKTSLSSRTLQAHAERWRPWRGYAAAHLWEAAASKTRAPASINRHAMTNSASLA